MFRPKGHHLNVDRRKSGVNYQFHMTVAIGLNLISIARPLLSHTQRTRRFTRPARMGSGWASLHTDGLRTLVSGQNDDDLSISRRQPFAGMDQKYISRGRNWSGWCGWLVTILIDA